jgi:hypothetical protein
MASRTSYVNTEYTRDPFEQLLPPAVVAETLNALRPANVIKWTGLSPHLCRQAQRGNWGSIRLDVYLILEAVAKQEIHRKAATASFINR